MLASIVFGLVSVALIIVHYLRVVEGYAYSRPPRVASAQLEYE